MASEPMEVDSNTRPAMHISKQLPSSFFHTLCDVAVNGHYSEPLHQPAPDPEANQDDFFTGDGSLSTMLFMQCGPYFESEGWDSCEAAELKMEEAREATVRLLGDDYVLQITNQLLSLGGARRALDAPGGNLKYNRMSEERAYQILESAKVDVKAFRFLVGKENLKDAKMFNIKHSWKPNPGKLSIYQLRKELRDLEQGILDETDVDGPLDLANAPKFLKAELRRRANAIRKMDQDAVEAWSWGGDTLNFDFQKHLAPMEPDHWCHAIAKQDQLRFYSKLRTKLFKHYYNFIYGNVFCELGALRKHHFLHLAVEVQSLRKAHMRMADSGSMEKASLLLRQILSFWKFTVPHSILGSLQKGAVDTEFELLNPEDRGELGWMVSVMDFVKYTSEFTGVQVKEGLVDLSAMLAALGLGLE
ncbi:hypothetical protein BJ508DRAFT_311216 [Ascobolus immersus RN42]|uniref:Uncharacterized protein n=1 Tax=Ascobolus immersus RN42 TaxID=1160509 RepID=A0A3N4HWE4_ASCIM|nr:hypothetical protein BJ508DRAFT_311216 [Ascobolus immersus RN42]